MITYSKQFSILKEKKQKVVEGKKLQNASMTEEKKEDKVIKIRPLNMTDFREAKNQVSISLKHQQISVIPENTTLFEFHYSYFPA